MKICMCSLAGTKACLTCANNYEIIENDFFPSTEDRYVAIESFDTTDEFFKMIEELNKTKEEKK